MSGKPASPHDIGASAAASRGSHTSPQALALRAAGLKVTSARLAALRLAPEVLRDHRCLTPRNLYEAARRHGYVVSAAAFYRVLPRLANARLLPLPDATLFPPPNVLD